MSQPLKGLPLDLVIKTMTGYHVIPFDPHNKEDLEVLKTLEQVAKKTKEEVNKNGIKKKRANEAGNAIEPFVKKALIAMGYKADTPKTTKGKKKATGYPDLQFIDHYGKLHYLECKTFNKKNINTTQRSFYLSPSEDFKVTQDAHHFGISFELYVDGSEEEEHIYKIKGWKIVDLAKLELDIKYEFNAHNKRLYNKKHILSEADG